MTRLGEFGLLSAATVVLVSACVIAVDSSSTTMSEAPVTTMQRTATTEAGTIRLPRIVGHGHSVDLILTGRGVKGLEALQMGLVNRVTGPGEALSEAIGLAEQLAGFPQECLRNDRRLAVDQWDLDVERATENETRLRLATISSGEPLAGARGFAGGAGRHGGPV